MRVSKANVYRALEKAAKNIQKAAGDGGRTSRAEMKVALKGLKGPEKALTDIFFKFIDNRDAAPGASVTPVDLKKALVYAKEHMINKYDLDKKNGLSQAEISKMSTTGKLAVKLAVKLAAEKAAGEGTGGGRVSGDGGTTHWDYGDYNGGRIMGGEW